jgi:hypothetical protein
MQENNSCIFFTFLFTMNLQWCICLYNEHRKYIMNLKLHQGYVGITREGKRVEIIE